MICERTRIYSFYVPILYLLQDGCTLKLSRRRLALQPGTLHVASSRGCQEHALLVCTACERGECLLNPKCGGGKLLKQKPLSESA